MFCTECGKEIADDSLFCEFCGHSLKEGDAEKTAALDSLSVAAPAASVAGSAQAGSAAASAQAVPAQTAPAASAAATQVLTPAQAPSPAVTVPYVPVGADAQTQVQTQQAKSGQKSGKASTVVIICLLIVIVIVGALATLAIAKPPIEFLKDTPFSSVSSDDNDAANKNDSNSDSSKSKDGSQNNQNNQNGSNNQNSNNANSSQNNEQYGYLNNNSGSTNSGQKTNDSYIISYSASRLLTASDISNLTNDQIVIAQNEIWARHGRKFKNNWLQNYFNTQKWYSGTIEADSFLKTYKPSTIEETNANFLQDTLNQRNYDVNKAHPN